MNRFPSRSPSALWSCFMAMAAVSAAWGGPSSVLVRKTVKEAAETVAKKTVGEAAGKAMSRIAREFGEKAADDIAQAARLCGKSSDEAAAVARRLHKHVLRGDAMDAERLAFALRHGEAGQFLLRRFPDAFSNLRKYGWDRPEAADAVREAWRLTDPHAVGGSWKSLREALTKADINGPGRDFCERLFLDRAKAGRIPGIPKGAAVHSGHIGNSRQGLDFHWVGPDGKLEMAEFGTGAKPIDAAEMTLDKVRRQFADHLDGNPDLRITLRGEGCDPRLLDPRNLADPDFPIHDFIRRHVYATESNGSLLRRLKAEPGGVEFHLLD